MGRSARIGPRPERRLAKTVLIAEDNALNRRLFADVLRGCGFAVVEAADGAEALAGAAEHRPDLLLLDMDMPRVGGDEVARRLRADPMFAGVPILAISAHSGEAANAFALHADCDAWLQKPIRPNALIDAVESRIGSAGGA